MLAGTTVFQHLTFNLQKNHWSRFLAMNQRCPGQRSFSSLIRIGSYSIKYSVIGLCIYEQLYFFQKLKEDIIKLFGL